MIYNKIFFINRNVKVKYKSKTEMCFLSKPHIMIHSINKSHLKVLCVVFMDGVSVYIILVEGISAHL